MEALPPFIVKLYILFEPPDISNVLVGATVLIPILPSEVMRSFSLFPFVLNWNESSDLVYLIAPLLLSVPVPSPKNIVPALVVPENIVIPCSPLVFPTIKSSEPLSASGH